jgi:hypothetical protein
MIQQTLLQLPDFGAVNHLTYWFLLRDRHVVVAGMVS